MKKFLVFALASVLIGCLLLAACAEPTPTPTSTPTPTPTPTTTTTPTPTTTTTPTPTPTPTPTLEPGEVIELNISYHAPPMAGLATYVIVPWANDLEAATNGRVKIIHHPGGTLLSSSDAYDGVLTGICDLAQVTTEEYPGRFPRSSILHMPLFWPNTEIAAIAYHEFLNKWCLDTELKDVKLLVTLPYAPTDWVGNKPLEKLEDWQGMKIRASGEWDSRTYETLGAVAVPMATTDLFSAIDTGMVDGAMFALEGSVAFGFLDVTKYKTALSLTQGLHHLHMNRQVYNKLPDDIKKIFDEFSTLETSRKYAASSMAEEAGIVSLVQARDEKAGNPPMYFLPQEEAARWSEALQPVPDKWIASMDKLGLPGQEMMDDCLSIIEKYSQP